VTRTHHPALQRVTPAAAPGELAAGIGRKIIIAALAALVCWTGLAFFSDVRELGGTAYTFSPAAFMTAISLALGNYVLRIVRWHYYLRRLGVRIGSIESSLVFLSGMLMSVTPGKIGEVFKSLLLYESRRIPIERTVPVVVAERLTDLVALGLLIAVGSLALEHGQLVTLASAGFAVLLLLFCAYAPLGHWTLRQVARVRALHRFVPRLEQGYSALLRVTRPVPLLLGSTIGFVAWGLQCGSLYAIANGFEGVRLGLRAATFAYSAPTVAGAFAMIPSGLGVTEVAMTELLKALGGDAMTPAVATVATILVRIATLWFSVALGLVGFAAYRATWRNRIAVQEQP
jgi:uncharacterized protein (TIRG00374 family)